MKTILEFSLPDEEEEFKAAMAGSKLSGKIHDFYWQSLRERTKYHNLTEEQFALVEEIKEEFLELFNEWT